jgi:very-short-patch-repair endonuclease
VIRGQPVRQSKKELARQMRKQMTSTETLLWGELRDHRLHGAHFRRQQVIGGYIADFYCHAAGLVVEVDGKYHEDRAEYDAERDKAISMYDLTVIRFTNDEVIDDLLNVLDRITLYLPASKGANNDSHQ